MKARWLSFHLAFQKCGFQSFQTSSNPAFKTSRQKYRKTAVQQALCLSRLPDIQHDRRIELCQSGRPAFKPSGNNACQIAGKRATVPPMIITIANNKGGVGKSTLAVHLAAWLVKQGHSVTLADCDTQQSSSVWIREAVPEVETVVLSSPSCRWPRQQHRDQPCAATSRRLRHCAL